MGPEEQERLCAYCHGNPPVFVRFLQLVSPSLQIGYHMWARFVIIIKLLHNKYYHYNQHFMSIFLFYV